MGNTPLNHLEHLQMSKYLNAWIERRDASSARSLVNYLRKHPMAACMMTEGDHAEWQGAIAFLEGDA